MKLNIYILLSIISLIFAAKIEAMGTAKGPEVSTILVDKSDLVKFFPPQEAMRIAKETFQYRLEQREYLFPKKRKKKGLEISTPLVYKPELVKLFLQVESLNQ